MSANSPQRDAHIARRNGRFALRIAVAGVILLVVVLALVQLRSRGPGAEGRIMIEIEVPIFGACRADEDSPPREK